MAWVLVITMMVGGKPALPSTTGPYLTRAACMKDYGIQKDSFVQAGFDLHRFVMRCEAK